MSAGHRAHRTQNLARLGTAALAAGALTAGALVGFASTSTAASPSGDARTIVSNGDFASPAQGSGFITVAAGGHIGAWQVTAGDVDVQANSLRPVPAGDPSTTQSIDLDGLTPGTISQSLATTPGWTYTGSFELGVNPSAPGGSASGTYTIGSGAPVAFTTPPGAASDLSWTNVPFTFVATSASTPITFASTTPGSSGASITDVVVDPPLTPTITTAPDKQVLQTTASGTSVAYTAPTAADPNQGGASLPVNCNHASGATFPVGTTTVTCTATSPSGPSASSTFKITVKQVVSSCESRALGFDGAKSLSIEQANPAITPCAAKSGALLVTSATLAPGGLLGINSIKASGSILKSSTTAAFGATAATDSASDSVASISFIAPGISLKTSTVTAQASSTLSASCAGTTTGFSDIEGLVINGKHYTVGTASLTIPLGLGLQLNLNQRIVTGNVITVRAFSITSTHPNASAYHTVIGEAVAGLSCS